MHFIKKLLIINLLGTIGLSAYASGCLTTITMTKKGWYSLPNEQAVFLLQESHQNPVLATIYENGSQQQNSNLCYTNSLIGANIENSGGQIIQFFVSRQPYSSVNGPVNLTFPNDFISLGTQHLK